MPNLPTLSVAHEVRAIAQDREADRLRVVLAAILKRIDQSEQYEREACMARDALGLCMTTGCENPRCDKGDWPEYCLECIRDAE